MTREIDPMSVTAVTELKQVLGWVLGSVATIIVVPVLLWVTMESVENRAFRSRQEVINTQVSTSLTELRIDVKALPDEIARRIKHTP